MKEASLTPDDWMARGYRRFELKNSPFNKMADFLLQKLFDDEFGKRYYLSVYVYDRAKYQPDNPVRWGFLSSVQFTIQGTSMFSNVEMSSMESIDEVERHYEKLWEYFGKQYYEEYE